MFMAASPLAAQERDEHPAWAFYNLGVDAYLSGRHREAIEQLNLAATGLDDPRVFYFRGLALSQLGQSVDARADFVRGARLERDRIDLRHLRLSETDRLSQVNSALTRVQGPQRAELEKLRLVAVGQIRTAQKFKERKLAQLQRGADNIIGLVNPEPPAKPSYRDLKGQEVVYDGKKWQVLEVDANNDGVRTLTLLDGAVSLDPQKYERTGYKTPQGWLTGEAALRYRMEQESLLLPASQAGRVETKLLGPLALNPMSQRLTDQATAKKGWQEFREKEQERLRQIAAAAAELRAQQEQLLAQQRAEEERRLAAGAAAANAAAPIVMPAVLGEAPPESFAVDASINALPPSVTPAGVDWAVNQAEQWSFDAPAAPAADEDRMNRALQKILAAAALHIVKLATQSDQAHRAAANEDGSIGLGNLIVSLVGEAVGCVRDQQIESALADAFPDVPRAGHIAMRNVISLAADGRLRRVNALEVVDYSVETGKDVLIAELQRHDPQTAGNLQAVEFLAKVVMALPSPPAQ